ncbi:MAG: hypothetical protein ABL921_07135, partial [Pirellula sp.]
LYSSGWDKKIRRWNLETQQEVTSSKSPYVTSVIAASSDGKWIAIAYEKNRIGLISAKDGTERQVIETDGISCSAIAFNHASTHMAWGGETKDEVHVVVWNIAESKKQYHWKWNKGADPNSDINALTFSPDDRKIAGVVFRQNAGYAWDISNGHEIAHLDHRGVYDVDFTADGKSLLTVGWDSEVQTWNAANGAMESSHKLDKKQHDSRMYGVSCSSTGRIFATAHIGKAIRVWSIPNMEMRQLMTTDQFIFGAISFSPDGLWLVSGAMSGAVNLWDPWTGELVMNIGKHDSHVYSVGFGETVCDLYSGASDGICRVWNLERPEANVGNSLSSIWKSFKDGTADRSFQAMIELSKRPEEALQLIQSDLSAFNDTVVRDDHDVMPRRYVALLSMLKTKNAQYFLLDISNRPQNDWLAKMARASIRR